MLCPWKIGKLCEFGGIVIIKLENYTTINKFILKLVLNFTSMKVISALPSIVDDLAIVGSKVFLCFVRFFLRDLQQEVKRRLKAQLSPPRSTQNTPGDWRGFPYFRHL